MSICVQESWKYYEWPRIFLFGISFNNNWFIRIFCNCQFFIEIILEFIHMIIIIFIRCLITMKFFYLKMSSYNNIIIIIIIVSCYSIMLFNFLKWKKEEDWLDFVFEKELIILRKAMQIESTCEREHNHHIDNICQLIFAMLILSYLSCKSTC